MKFKLKLLEDEKQIEGLILNNIISNVSNIFNGSVPNIKKKLTDLLINKIKAEPEYDSLKNGQLRLEFGIPDTSVVDNIIETWSNSFIVEVQNIRKKGSKIAGFFAVKAIKADFNDIISSSDAIVYDNGIELPWLQWLLLDGSKIIVRNHEVKIGPSRFSRTGMALMTESKKNWRVPPQFAGTITNNWITRALSTINDEIFDIIQKEIEGNL